MDRGSGGSLTCRFQPIGNPSLSIWLRFSLTRHSGVSQALPAGAGFDVADVPDAVLLELDDDEFTFLIFELSAEPADDEFPFFAGAVFALLETPLFEFVFAGGFESAVVPPAGADEFGFAAELDGGVGLFFAYSAAAATSESRMARSVDSTRTRAIESALTAIVNNNPNTSMINWERRL